MRLVIILLTSILGCTFYSFGQNEVHVIPLKGIGVIDDKGIGRFRNFSVDDILADSGHSGGIIIVSNDVSKNKELAYIYGKTTSIYPFDKLKDKGGLFIGCDFSQPESLIPRWVSVRDNSKYWASTLLRTGMTFEKVKLLYKDYTISRTTSKIIVDLHNTNIRLVFYRRGLFKNDDILKDDLIEFEKEKIHEIIVFLHGKPNLENPDIDLNKKREYVKVENEVDFQRNAQKTADYINNKLADSKSSVRSVWFSTDGIVSLDHSVFGKLKFNPHEVYVIYNYEDDYTEVICRPALQNRLEGKYSLYKDGCILTNSKIKNQQSIWIDIKGFNEQNKALFNALKDLVSICEKQRNSYLKQESEKDIYMDRSVSQSRNTIKLKKQGDLFLIPITINDALKIDFLFDTGASDVFISPEILLTLMRMNSIEKSDLVGSRKYSFANGKSEVCKVYNLRSLKIGTRVVKNVQCAVANTIISDMLLGQSFLKRLGGYRFDNVNNEMILE